MVDVTSEHQSVKNYLFFFYAPTRHIWHTEDCCIGTTEHILISVGRPSFISWGLQERKVNPFPGGVRHEGIAVDRTPTPSQVPCTVEKN